MLKSLLKNLRSNAPTPGGAPRRLHIGGTVRRDGWEVLNISAGDAVDHVGDAQDLGRFPDETFAEIYASHVLEHLDFTGEIQAALKEWHRVLVVGGRLYVGVPDLAALSRLFVDERLSIDDRFNVMRMIFGAHEDAHDYHKVGLDFDILGRYLVEAGFADLQRVSTFGLFDDYTELTCAGMRMSLNVTACKPRSRDTGDA